VSNVRRQDFFFVAIPKLINGVTTLAISVWAVRFLDPASYGVLSFCTSCLLLFDGLLGSALDLGLTKWVTGSSEPRTSHLSAVEKAAICMKALLGAILVLLAALGGEAAGHRLFHQSGGRTTLMILTAAGSALLLLRSLQVYCQLRIWFALFGATDLLYSVLRIMLVGAVLLLGAAAPATILACYAAAPLLVVAAFSVGLWRRWAWRVSPQRLAHWREVAWASAPALLSFGVTSLAARMDLFFLALRSDPVQLGFYGAALTVATIPEVFGTYLAPVFLPRILPACREGVFFQLFRRFHRIACICNGVALVAGWLLLQPVLSFVFPVRYAPSLGIIRILLPGTLAAASVFPLTLNFLLLKRPRFFLLLDTTLAPVAAVAYIFVTPVAGAAGAAWITSVFRVVKSIIAQAKAFHVARPI
jgi:O-antigen/teichoic acid export membrane protein